MDEKRDLPTTDPVADSPTLDSVVLDVELDRAGARRDWETDGASSGPRTIGPAPRPPEVRTRPAAPNETVASSDAAVLDEHGCHEERVSYHLRLRTGMALAVVLWPFFGLTDYVIARTSDTPLAALLIVRFSAWGVLLVPLAIVWKKPLVPYRLVRLCDLFTFTFAAVAVSVLAVLAGGVHSSYFAGVLLIIVCRGAFVFDHWKTGVRNYAVVLASYPGLMIFAALADPGVAHQLGTNRGQAALALHSCFVACMAALVVASGHASWALRRQLFESRSIGRYRLKHRLGVGGMGEVWAAHHPGLRRDVAVKILKPGENTADRVRRFEREVEATVRLSHPNTVRMFDYGVTDDGLWYYVMELLQGSDLGTVVKSSGPLPPERALHLMLQAARALSEAHGKRVFHRDIKPENIFVTNAGGAYDFVKVLDFGVAKTPDETASSLTQTGTIFGTPDYISPEAARGASVDARSDVYGLGAVLYFALTAKPPFELTSTGSLLYAHIHDEPIPPSQRSGRTLPLDLEGIVMKCLQKDPADRYPDAGVLAEALEHSSLAGRWRPTSAPLAKSSDHGASDLAGAPTVIEIPR